MSSMYNDTSTTKGNTMLTVTGGGGKQRERSVPVKPDPKKK